MSDMLDPAAKGRKSDKNQRIFLVVVDETKEMERALRYACRRAQNSGGRVALLHVIEPADFQQWMTVADLIKEEEREAAERLLRQYAERVQDEIGRIAVLYIREGNPREELIALLEEEPTISILVLAAAGKDDPGPLVNFVTGKGLSRLKVPVTVIPHGIPEDTLMSIT